MKKILSTFIALTMCSLMSLATPTFTVTPTSVDFGTVALLNGEAEDSVAVVVTYADLQEYCGVYFDDAEVLGGDDATFWLSGTQNPGIIYGGDEWHDADDGHLQLHYYALAAGSYTAKIKFYTYMDEYWEVESDPVYLNISLIVTDEATGLSNAQTQSKAVKRVVDGQLVVEKNGVLYNVLGTKL